MKNLKKFATNADYNSFKNSTGMTYPLASYINDTRESKFDHWVPAQGSLKMYTDDDFYTNAFIEQTLRYDKWGQGNTFIFVEEIVYGGSYFWLWEASEETYNMWVDNFGVCSCNYILTIPFNNYNDLYEHTLEFNYNNRYCPFIVTLNEDMEETDYWQGGWVSLHADGILVAASGGTYTGNKPEVHSLDLDDSYSQAIMVLDGFEGEYISDIIEYNDEQYFDMDYSHGNHLYYDENPSPSNTGYAGYYYYDGIIEHNGTKYYLWEADSQNQDYYYRASLKYCLTSLNPDELYENSMAEDFYNRYTNFIFLKSDMEEYENNDNMTRYLVDVYGIVKN